MKGGSRGVTSRARARHDFSVLSCVLAVLVAVMLPFKWFEDDDFDQAHTVYASYRPFLLALLLGVLLGSVLGFLRRGPTAIVSRLVALVCAVVVTVAIVFQMLEPFVGAMAVVRLDPAWLGAVLSFLLVASTLAALLDRSTRGG